MLITNPAGNSRFPNRLFTDEAGVTTMEYGLIASLIVTVVIAAVSNMGVDLAGTFDTIASNLK